VAPDPRPVRRGRLGALSTVFAAEILHNLHRVDEVALEQAAGRGWMFRVGEEWYANGSTKQELKQLWGI
jgi:hypothetical protein